MFGDFELGPGCKILKFPTRSRSNSTFETSNCKSPPTNFHSSKKIG
jgi:hypothetical protein